MVFRTPEPSEPSYDECSIDMMAELEWVVLTLAILQYAHQLEDMVVLLRMKANEMTPQKKPMPFPDLHENIYETFEDYPAYQKLVDYLED